VQVDLTTNRDHAYLKLIRAGTTVPQVAKRFRVTEKTVYNGLKRARAAEAGPMVVQPIERPHYFEPLFPVLYLTPVSECPHRGPLPDGSSFICMVCSHASKISDRDISRRKAPPPQEPEQRIARLKNEVESGDLPDSVKQQATHEIAALEVMVLEEFRPTRYVPDPKLRGGVG
jgi:hypothetical protein